ncbi:hypothetical protein C7967_1153 [Thalassospira sp. 11-3]|nr:hypothetical protein C7967_1153 [Thalassospira sp. 11-3]
MFKEQHMGQLLDEKISSYLKEYVTTKDIVKTCKELKASYHTIRFVVNRTNPLSEKTAPIIEKLMFVAVDNCGNIIKKANEQKRKFSKMINV